jgi:hypothetical protein
MPGRPANQRIPIKPRTQSPEPWPASTARYTARALDPPARRRTLGPKLRPPSDSCGASGISGSAPCRPCGSIAERCDSLGLLALSDAGSALSLAFHVMFPLLAPALTLLPFTRCSSPQPPADDLPGGHPFGGERVPWPSVALASHAADGPAGRTPDVPRFPGTSPCLMSVNSRR